MTNISHTPSNPDANLPSAEQFARIAADRAVVSNPDRLTEAHFYNRTQDALRKAAEEAIQ